MPQMLELAAKHGEYELRAVAHLGRCKNGLLLVERRIEQRGKAIDEKLKRRSVLPSNMPNEGDERCQSASIGQ